MAVSPPTHTDTHNAALHPVYFFKIVSLSLIASRELAIDNDIQTFEVIFTYTPVVRLLETAVLSLLDRPLWVRH